MFSAAFISGSRDFTQRLLPVCNRCADFNTDSADACILVIPFRASLSHGCTFVWIYKWRYGKYATWVPNVVLYILPVVCFSVKKVYYLMRKVYSPLFGSWNEVPWDMGDLPIEPILVSQSLYTLRHHLGELSPSLRFLWHKFHLCLFFQLTGPGKRHNGNSKVMRL